MLKIDSKNALRILIIGLGVLLVIIAIGIVSSRVASQDKNIKIEYAINDANSTTVFDALKKYSENKKIDLKYNNNYSYGVFVESIAGVKNGDDGKYWQYYVNDKLGEVAADKKEVKAGDKVEWRFEDVSGF
ncbi:DUF4430 domain-containing protein [Patescibacteria group bacterium]|nr:DUF4430 domain-containing protein [Patescibacteria group bacterium]MBU4580160.1 DUF4430 domain-containing protein [Patescibacteria group bacterium]